MYIFGYIRKAVSHLLPYRQFNKDGSHRVNFAKSSIRLAKSIDLYIYIYIYIYIYGLLPVSRVQSLRCIADIWLRFQALLKHPICNLRLGSPWLAPGSSAWASACRLGA